MFLRYFTLCFCGVFSFTPFFIILFRYLFPPHIHAPHQPQPRRKEGKQEIIDYQSRKQPLLAQTLGSIVVDNHLAAKAKQEEKHQNRDVERRAAGDDKGRFGSKGDEGDEGHIKQ